MRSPTTVAIDSLATVLEYDAKKDIWDSHLVDLLGKDPKLPPVCYIFLESGAWFKDKTKCTESDRLKILEPFHAPDFLGSQLCTDLNGFYGSRSSFASRGSNVDTLSGLDTWFRILTKKFLRPEEVKPGQKDYVWFEMGFFTHWRAAEPSTSRVLCIGTPPEMTERIRSLAMDGRLDLELRDPFALLPPLFEEMMRVFDDCVWRVTKRVRAVELNRWMRPDFEALRNLGRHTAHIVEVQQVTIETLERLICQQESNFRDLHEELGRTYRTRAREQLAFQLQIMKSLRWRTMSTQDRLVEEITLAYNMLASSDNAIMKSITLLTMIFLPATFISALFSTTFFSFDDGGWRFSDQFWIYWAFTIPLTIVVLMAWWWWLGGSYEVIRSRWLREKQD